MSPQTRLWRALLVAAVALAVIIGVGSTRYARAAMTTAMILPEIFWDMPVRPLSILGHDIVRDRDIFVPGANPAFIDIYRPADDKPRGALVVPLGAVMPNTRSDPRVVRMAQAVARSGTVIMIIETPNLNQGVVVPEDIETLIQAFLYLRQQPYVDSTRVGFMAFSVGASLALIAAQDPRLNQDVAFVASFGGYYNLLDLIAAVTTKTIIDNGRLEAWQPRLKALNVIRRSVIATVEDPVSRDLLHRAVFNSDETARAVLERYDPAVYPLYRLLNSQHPQQVYDLVDDVPTRSRETLEQLSPSTGAHELRTKLFVIHSRDDFYVPYTESRRFVKNLQGQTEVHYAELSIFRHVDTRLPLNILTLLRDIANLFFQIYLLNLEVN